MLGPLLTFLGAVYALLNGLDVLPKWLSVSSLGLLAVGTVPVLAYTLYTSVKELITTKHGRIKLLVHGYLKSSLSPWAYKKAIRQLPKSLLYCDLFSGILFEGNTTLIMFYKNCSPGSNYIVPIAAPSKTRYERRFIQASVFILMLRRLVRLRKGPENSDKGMTQFDIRDFNYGIELVNHDSEIEVITIDMVTQKQVTKSYKLYRYKADGANDRGNLIGQRFFHRYKRPGLIIFDYLRDVLLVTKDHNSYLVKYGKVDMTSITCDELLHYASVGQSRTYLNNAFCRVGGTSNSVEFL